MEFESFIKELKAIQGLDDLRPDSDGVYSLKINHMHLLYFSESSDGNDLFLYASLCHIPTDDAERLSLFDRLLNANLFGKETGEAWFAADSTTHQILLMSRLTINQLDMPAFSSILRELVTHISHWKDMIENFSVRAEKKQMFLKM